MRKRAKHIKGSVGLPSTIYKDEVAAITARRRAVGLTPPPIPEQDEPTPSVKDRLIGLALSGGGIRSAWHIRSDFPDSIILQPPKRILRMIRLPEWTELDEEIRDFLFNLSEAHFVRQILQFPAEN